jgi:hypothetical protein
MAILVANMPFDWRKNAKNGHKKNMAKSGKKWRYSNLQLQKPLYSFCNCETDKVSYVCGGLERPHT